MTLSQSHPYLSPEEYLETEKSSPIKHQYIQGQIYAMSGASDAHVTITANLLTLLRNHIRGTGCRVYVADMKARIESLNIFYYPDIMVTCDQRDTNFEYFKRYPSLIIEVLSPSTEAFDRGDKFSDYQELETLQEYVLGLLQKNAEDVKGGAGQYFTPRALIQAIVEVMQPKPGQRICDPACGTGGFFLVASDRITKNYKLDKAQKQFLKNQTFKGFDVADGVVRLCAMNLYLHGIAGDESPVEAKDSLMADPGDRFELVLTNPPFGKKSSITVFNDDGKADKEKVVYRRDDFWATTSNKQLNFLQHVKTLLQINGKAAVVVPDNVLFEGGAGETIRKKLLHECDVHTLLRLPTGIFYAQGVKANVLFFDRKPASADPWTKKLWIYDFRTNQHFTLKTNTLRYENLQDFIQCFKAENREERQETERFRAFTYEELMQRDKVSLDIFWLRDESLEDSNNLPAPDVLALEIAEDLEAALELFQSITENLEAKTASEV